jgi:hypothetical protein
MMFDPLTLVVLGIVFVSTLVMSTFGFGLGMVSMPLLALVLPIRSATPLVGMVGTTIILMILLQHWRDIDVKSVWRLLLASLAGIPLGLFLLKGGEDTVLKLALALVILLFSCYMLLTKTPFRLTSNHSSFVFGFLAGITGSAFNMGGPPVVIYGTLRGWTPAAFRATLQGFFFPTSFLVMTAHFGAGLWTPPVIRYYVLSLPLVLISLVVGGWLNRALPKGRFDQIIYSLLIAIGTLLLIRSIW